ncbi:hypothetical protein J2J97_32330 (plasmid) [Rhizobium bangladeshense]|uniref:hypothetical protein n=1 Tax=Rhizobium bangladeshense TaxID=1138189 RepID=UPI001A98DE09|nr:hypothetical protein [Rhizobium bangladeshense]QSY98593.1 hypothetical protein J2J97_32330 [Rhizobium bangladeshense]
MKLSDIDVRELAKRLDAKGDTIEDFRRRRRDADNIAIDLSSGLIAAAQVMWGLSQVFRAMADDHDAVPPVNGRALDLDDDKA